MVGYELLSSPLCQMTHLQLLGEWAAPESAISGLCSVTTSNHKPCSHLHFLLVNTSIRASSQPPQNLLDDYSRKSEEALRYTESKDCISIGLALKSSVFAMSRRRGQLWSVSISEGDEMPATVYTMPRVSTLLGSTSVAKVLAWRESPSVYLFP